MLRSKCLVQVLYQVRHSPSTFPIVPIPPIPCAPPFRQIPNDITLQLYCLAKSAPSSTESKDLICTIFQFSTILIGLGLQALVLNQPTISCGPQAASVSCKDKNWVSGHLPDTPAWPMPASQDKMCPFLPSSTGGSNKLCVCESEVFVFAKVVC